jgi:hypothetical protein
MRLISLRNFLFLPLLFFLTIISIYISYKFEINFFIFFVFSLICNLYLLSSLIKQSSFFHFFLAMYIWLGFYFKFIINLLFNFDGSWGETGSLVNSQFLYNETLLVSIFGIAGFFFSHLFQLIKYNSYLNIQFDFKTHPKISKFSDLILFKKKKIFFFLFFFSIIIFVFNIKFNIYEKGIVQNNDNDIINYSRNIIKWLLFFGLTSFSCYFLHYLLLKRKIYNFAIIVIIFENFLSNLSMLSRGMFINVLAVFYGIYKMNEYYKLHFKNKKIILVVFIAFALFIASVVLVNKMRFKSYYILDGEKLKITSTIKHNSTVLKEPVLFSNFHLIYILVLNRFVGFDSLLALVQNKEKLSYDFLIESLKFKENTSDVTFFSKIQSETLENIKGKNPQSYFIKTPGIISYLYYSGSALFLLISTFLIGLTFIFFEKLVFNFLNSNYLIVSLISNLVVYRLIHFGYDPTSTLKYFLLIILNILFLKFLFILYDKVKK